MVGDRTGATTRLPVLRHRRRQPALRQGRRDRRRDVGGAAGGVGGRFRRRPRRRSGDARRPGRHQLLRRAAAAVGDRARGDPPAGHLPVRRRVLGTRCAHRRPGARGAAGGVRGRDGRHCVAAHFDGGRGRPDRSSSTTAGWWARARTRRCWRTARPTPSSPTRSRWAGVGGSDDRPDGPPDPRDGAGADGTVARLQGLGDPAGQTADPATRVDRHGDPAGHRRDRDRRDRPADPRARHRSVVQRCDRAPAARRSDQGAGHRGRPRPRRQHIRRSAVGHERRAGPGRGLRRHRSHAAAGAGAVSDCRAAGLASGPAAQRDGAAHDGGAAIRRRGQGAPAAAVLLRLPPTR